LRSLDARGQIKARDRIKIVVDRGGQTVVRMSQRTPRLRAR
jgi:hypothetical protein